MPISFTPPLGFIPLGDDDKIEAGMYWVMPSGKPNAVGHSIGSPVSKSKVKMNKFHSEPAPLP